MSLFLITKPFCNWFFNWICKVFSYQKVEEKDEIDDICLKKTKKKEISKVSDDNQEQKILASSKKSLWMIVWKLVCVIKFQLFALEVHVGTENLKH